MNFAVGSLIAARGREWVVLPDSTEQLVIARPLGGTDDEIAGICTALEEVKPACFSLPDPESIGDSRSCRMLQNALRLGFRSSAGPFRCFGKIAVEPRPYQLVPLLMALKLDPIRLLIADDVGVGKTIEALLVARELIDRGERQRLTVLCPPHLAEQWQREMSDKFHIQAELVLSGTVRRLERQCGIGQSLYEVYPFTVTSVDYIKSDRRRSEFIRTCPNLVIVDEAHGCAYEERQHRSRHQRYELVRELVSNAARHMIFVTATPHSGKEAAFHSLLSFLDPEFAQLSENLAGKENEPIRRKVAAHFVQRRRADIRHFLDKETVFPVREDKEDTYSLTPEYKQLFARILSYAREIVCDESGGRHRMRVRWWSALALLRALGSSPAAAAATLRSRSATIDTVSAEEADEVGRRQVMDQDDTDSPDATDITPGARLADGEGERTDWSRRKLLDLAREADKLRGQGDAKLQKTATLLKALLKDGYRPIVFCRFIQTAEYVAEYLREMLPNRIAVTAVTGTLPPEERENRVLELTQSDPRVLVCTDCLSEGINLQDNFDAVFHYDLSWNPTRHEQREGRVDRFGQPRPTVRCLTFYGIDNQIDGIVLDVLLRKHRKIRSSLGISVPVPAESNAVVEAIFEGLLLREHTGTPQQMLLPGFDDLIRRNEANKRLQSEWDNATLREKRSRTMFAQEAMQSSVEEVAREVAAVREAVGTGSDVETFTRTVLTNFGASITNQKKHTVFDLSEVPQALRELCGNVAKFKAHFEMPVDDGVLYLTRTHPIVEGLATYVLNTALDGDENAIARRCGVIYTDAVQRRTTLLLLRYRYHIIMRDGDQEKQLLAEDSQVVGFAGAPTEAEWIDARQVAGLLDAMPSRNIDRERAALFVQRVIGAVQALTPQLERFAAERGEQLLHAHRRVRTAARWNGVRHEIRPELPPDILGIYVYLPGQVDPE
ncbi:MAG: ATP-dependent helicase [Desulfobacteraceae bacterium]|nr:MAG: ATP-dependent helicase [Desulfobacteraceae bacterium]